MTQCMKLLIQSFDFMSISDILIGPNTIENRRRLGQVHWQTFQDHLAKYPSTPVGIKCVYNDPTSGVKQIVGFAEWFIFDRSQAEDERLQLLGFMSPPWVDDDSRKEQIKAYFDPSIDVRSEIMGGRPYGLLLWLCVDPSFRRKGVASMIVQWGMRQCAKLRIPAYLEASKEGQTVYEKLGWKPLNHPRCEEIGCQIMTLEVGGSNFRPSLKDN